MTKITSGEVVAIAGTAARYMLAENIARRVEKDKPIGLAMGAFVTSDILDGMILREFDLDTPMRRITDGIVDHASQIRVAFEVVKKHPSARPYIGILAVRAAIVGGLNSLHLATTGEATRGGLNQESTNLAAALFGVTAASGDERMTHITGALMSGVAIATIPSHFKGLCKKHEGGVRKL